jgi:hypothetical protein
LVGLVRDAIRLLNKRHGLDLGLYVAGDTTETGVGDASSLVVGKAAVSAVCSAPPTRFDASDVRQAVDDFPELPEEYWHELGVEVGIETKGSKRAEPILMSWGPLCYGNVSAGVALTKDQQGEATYGFITNHDMLQERAFEGLDGKTVRFMHPQGYERAMFVEFDRICLVDMSEEAVDSYFEQVSEHDDASLFMTCRYD